MLSDRFAKLQKVFRTSPKTEDKRSKLSFSILGAEHGNIVEEMGFNPRRSVSKSGSGYIYSLCGALNSNDMRCVEITKEYLISSICSTGDQQPLSIKDAQSLAKLKLPNLTSPDKVELLSYLVAHDTVGYGPISILMEDKKNIEEIEINSPNSSIMIYSTKYGRCMTNLCFSNEHAFRSTVNRMIRDTEKELNENTPIIDAQVADLRIHAQIKPYALSGAAASIRIGGRKEIDLGYLIKTRTANSDILAYLWLAFELKQNIVVSGAPASGKTTLLSALTAFVPSNEKIVTIEEDINEIKNNSPYHIVGLYGSRYNSVSPKEQVINSLRMRPSRILVGEMRGDEAKDLFMGANLGISFAATMHSNEGGMQILKKLMIKPMCVETRSLSMLDIAIYMRQVDVTSRIISGISEYRWLSRAEIKEGEDISQEDMVGIRDVASNSRIDKSELKDSKVIEYYSRVHEISQKDAIKELERRSKLIADCFAQGKNLENEITRYSGW